MKFNKKSVAVIFVLLTVVVTGWFLVSQNSKNKQSKQSEKQNSEISKEMVSQNKQGEQEVRMERETVQTKPQLSKEEIEKSKKEKDLVWYEIPELGVKFLVTRNMKKNLVYKMINNKGLSNLLKQDS